MYKEMRIIDVDLLRSFCIENGFYTAGTGADYEKIFMCAEFYNNELFGDHSAYVKALAWIAVDIKDHSKDIPYNVESLMWKINRECVCVSYYYENK